MPTPIHSLSRWLGAGALAGLVACSDLPPLPIGQLRLGLSSGIGDARYRLDKASFAIEGAAQLQLSSADSPDSDTLQRSLPVGDYSAQLLPGWQLQRTGAAGTQPVAAELVSRNPLDFSIRAGELTTVTFQFRTSGEPGQSPGGGDLRVAIEVDGKGAPLVVISELMKNPEALPDADGEWLELYNAGTQDLDLSGCELRRDEQTLPLEEGFSIAAGAYLTFSNGEMPGFQPDVLYRGITLPNTGSFVLALACGSQLIDQVTIDSSALPNKAGHSLSLASSALDPAANDRPENWCDGVSAYNGDFGTPGEDNPACAR
ncbi:MAG TPA: lamin tail domain-containing protein [Polyangiaceae bacterium]|nr:lamin tail domain-containing protein [Polyangiaceae bacterium]